MISERPSVFVFGHACRGRPRTTFVMIRDCRFCKRTLHQPNNNVHKTPETNSYNMQSPSHRKPSRISSFLSIFESNISKNKESTSKNFLSNIASTRRPYHERRHRRFTTTKDIEDEYEKIINSTSDEFKTKPPIAPTRIFDKDGVARNKRVRRFDEQRAARAEQSSETTARTLPLHRQGSSRKMKLRGEINVCEDLTNKR
jgi:hypothetical protein